MVEETLGPYERKLLLLNKGKEVFNLVTGDNCDVFVEQTTEKAG